MIFKVKIKKYFLSSLERYFLLVLFFASVYLLINGCIFYLYRYLNIYPSETQRLLYIFLQGNDYGSGKLQFYYSQLILLGMTSISSLLPFMVLFRRSAKKFPEGNSEFKNELPMLILSVMLCLAIVGRRYLTLLHPPGFDTPLYIAELTSLKMGTYDLSYFTLSGLFYPFYGLGLSAEEIIKLIPVILVLGAMLSTYFLLKTSYSGSRLTPIIATLFVPLSLTIIRQSADLFKSLLTYSLVLLLFTFYTKYQSRGDKLSLIIIWIILPYMMLYGIGWLLFISTVILFTILSFVKLRKKEIITRTALCLLTSFGIVILGLVFTPYAINRLIANLLNTYSFNTASFTSNIITFLNIQVEQSIFILLSIAGLLVIYRERNSLNNPPQFFSLLIISYCSVISIGFLFTQSYRMLLYFPFPICSSIGFSSVIANLQKSVNKIFSYTRGIVVIRRDQIASLFVITLTLSTSLYYENSLTETTGYPPDKVVACLKWVSLNIGNDVIVIVNEYNSQVNWIPAIIPPRIYRGDSIYLGTIFDFIEGKPSKLSGYPLADPKFFESYYQDFLEGKLFVLVIDGFYYKVNEFEKNLLSSIYNESYYTVYALGKINDTTINMVRRVNAILSNENIGYIGSLKEWPNIKKIVHNAMFIDMEKIVSPEELLNYTILILYNANFTEKCALGILEYVRGGGSILSIGTSTLNIYKLLPRSAREIFGFQNVAYYISSIGYNLSVHNTVSFLSFNLQVVPNFFNIVLSEKLYSSAIGIKALPESKDLPDLAIQLNSFSGTCNFDEVGGELNVYTPNGDIFGSAESPRTLNLNITNYLFLRINVSIKDAEEYLCCLNSFFPYSHTFYLSNEWLKAQGVVYLALSPFYYNNTISSVVIRSLRGTTSIKDVGFSNNEIFLLTIKDSNVIHFGNSVTDTGLIIYLLGMLCPIT